MTGLPPPASDGDVGDLGMPSQDCYVFREAPAFMEMHARPQERCPSQFLLPISGTTTDVGGSWCDAGGDTPTSLIRFSCPEGPIRKVTNKTSYLFWFVVKRETACIENVEFRIGYIPPICFCLSDLERRIVPTPDNQYRWLVVC
jgi:hypothetical protein